MSAFHPKRTLNVYSPDPISAQEPVILNRNPLGCLVGRRVTEAVEIHDYVQLAFGTKVGISIYNDFEISPNQVRFHDLTGLKVTAVQSSADQEAILFEDGVSLRVDIRDEAFEGPEAMQLNRIGCPPVVWN
jgi:hypothetical protein